MIAFKNYCWCVGTTSFRVEDLNYKNELQLNYLDQLFREHPNEKWRDLQSTYYNLLTSVGFKNGLAERPDKDARELTSGLADIGLVFRDSRKLTEVGEEIRKLSRDDDFKSNNVFGISKDSYVYLLQFLKIQVSVGEETIRPFVSLLYLLCKLGKLSRKQFTYLLPTCTSTNDVITTVGEIRADSGDSAIDGFLLKKMMSMNNYSEALNFFLSKTIVDEATIELIGMNRKSGKYDRPFYGFFVALEEYWKNKNADYMERARYAKEILKTWNLINRNQGSSWGLYLSISKTKNVDSHSFLDKLSSLSLFSPQTESAFREAFFKTWHLFKWKSTLEDYYDLNKRYFSLTDIVTYSNEEFSLTETARLYFEDIIDKLLFSALIPTESYEAYLTGLRSIKQINLLCNKTKDDIANLISLKYGKKINGDELDDYLKGIRANSFKRLIDDKFPKNTLIALLDAFAKRDDATIHSLVSEDASPSTSFEYIVGIIWYNLSGRVGSIEDCFNLTLNSNLLPVIHAGGNMPDLQFKYGETEIYPAHTLILEVTLSEASGQRHMEWEPVSRHLENQLQASKNNNDYAVFASSLSYQPTIKSFRAMKKYVVGPDESNGPHLKIIPLDAALLKNIVLKDLKYSQIYQLFAEAFDSDLWNMEWYRNEIENKLS